MSSQKHHFSCKDIISPYPLSSPPTWLQRPLLFRPSPNTNMRIRGIRHADAKEYLELPGTGYCTDCALPINNGWEAEGKSLVIDFETDSFIGTCLLRIKNANTYNTLNGRGDIGRSNDISTFLDDFNDKENNNKSTKPNKCKRVMESKQVKNPVSPKVCYFEGKKRMFQFVVRGRFLRPDIPMSECVTGQVFDRPVSTNHLPRWMIKSIVKVTTVLSPQLQIRLGDNEGTRLARCLSPLVSTAQRITCKQITDPCISSTQTLSPGVEECDVSIEDDSAEPNATSSASILNALCGIKGQTLIPIGKSSDKIKSRVKLRKKIFDKMFKEKNRTLMFEMNTEYEFEFFQHLISFQDDLSLEFAKPIGQCRLSRVLKGQPLKVMAAQQIKEDGNNGEKLKWFWCFDIWHEKLYADAEANIIH